MLLMALRLATPISSSQSSLSRHHTTSFDVVSLMQRRQALAFYNSQGWRDVHHRAKKDFTTHAYEEAVEGYFTNDSAQEGIFEYEDISDALIEDPSDEEEELNGSTEWIVRLQRQGDGWGEEIFPVASVVHRPINRKKRIRDRSTAPRPWKEGSLELFLVAVGVPKEKVVSVVAAATSWRITPKGRPLVDRRRRSRVTRNMESVAEYLKDKCGIEPGKNGLGALLLSLPQLLLVKPASSNKWGRRLLELAVFIHKYGHSTIPIDWPDYYLYRWVRHQREDLFSQEFRSTHPERVKLLGAIGFAADYELSVMSPTWNRQYEILSILIKTQNDDWNLYQWAEKGYGQLAIWVQLQREFKRRMLLPTELSKELDAIGFVWDSGDGWLENFGKIAFYFELYKIEEKMKKNSKNLKDSYLLDSKEMIMFKDIISSIEIGSRFLKSVSLCSARDMKLELGLSYWLSKQRCLWRSGKLEEVKITIFYILGLDLDIFTSDEWTELAHLTAYMLCGSKITNPGVGTREILGVRSLKNDHYVMPEEVVAIEPTGDVLEKSKIELFQRSEGRKGLKKIWFFPLISSDNKYFLQLSHLWSSLTNQNIESGDKYTECDSNTSLPILFRLKQKVKARLDVKRWIETQIALKKDGRLSNERITYLKCLGIEWIAELDLKGKKSYQKDWDLKFENLVQDLNTNFSDIDDKRPDKAYHKIPEFKKKLNTDSLNFLIVLRSLHVLGYLKSGDICYEAINDLLGIGWESIFEIRNPEERQWDKNISMLLICKKKNGHGRISKSLPLGKWYEDILKNKPSLPSVYLKQLSALNMVLCD